ncbi:MAG: hypothetical protein ACI4EN_04200 [Butyrivibrio sp.]
MKKIAFLILTVIIIVGVSGCMNKNEDSTNKMMNYINEKYDDSFEFIKLFGGYLGSSTKSIIVRSGKYPDYDVYVYCTTDNEQDTFADNYLSVKFYDKTLDYLQDIYREKFGETVYVHYSIDNTSNTQNASDETTFEEFIMDPMSMITYKVVLPYNNNKDEMEQSLKETMSELSGCAYIYLVDSSVKITSDEEMQECIESKNYNNKVYIQKNNDEFKIFRWENK